MAPCTPRLSMSLTCRVICAASSELYPTCMCLGCPNQGRRCAYILVVDPGYSRVRKETLLTLATPAFPLFCVVKVFAALVLLPLSIASVVVGVMVVCAVHLTLLKVGNITPKLQNVMRIPVSRPNTP